MCGAIKRMKEAAKTAENTGFSQNDELGFVIDIFAVIDAIFNTFRWLTGNLKESHKVETHTPEKVGCGSIAGLDTKLKALRNAMVST